MMSVYRHALRKKQVCIRENGCVVIFTRIKKNMQTRCHLYRELKETQER